MHGKSKITEMLPKSFKPQKCKTSLKLAVSRIKLLKNRKEAAVKQMRRDLAQLLEGGQEQTARIRVEHVIREEKTMSAYELVEIYCEIIDSRLPIIEKQKNCPIDLKEAIASVMFASPRCADIPELMEVRKQFTAKYGKEFVRAALEVRPDCGVNHMMVEKLSANPPDIQTKRKVLNEVAKEHNINWESKVFEEQVQKPKDDLLSGPSSFTSSEKISIISSDVNPSFVNSWKSESTTKASQQNLASQSQEEVKSTYAKEENVPMSRSNWKMEFKDATSAAEAAAESAERASMAARAAAELASRGNISRQSSSAAYNSSAYVQESEEVECTNSNLERKHTSRASVAAQDGKGRGSHSEKPKMQNRHKDDMVQTSKSTKNETFHNTDTTRQNVMSEEPQFGDSSDDDMASDDNFEPYNYDQNNFPVPGSASKNSKNDRDGNCVPRSPKNDNNENYGARYDIRSSVYSNAFDEYATRDDNEEDTKVQSSGVHYDNYDSDTDDHSLTEPRNLLDSFLTKTKEESSTLSVNMDSWSPKHRTAVSPSNISSSHFSEPHQIDSAETMEKANLHSDSDESLPPKFDSPKFDSEGPNSESEDEVEKSNPVESVRPSNFLHTDSSLRKGLPSKQPSHRKPSYDTTEVDQSNVSSSSTVPPVVDNRRMEPGSTEKNWRSGLSVRNNQQNQRGALSPQWGGMTEEEQPPFTVTSDEAYDDGILNFGRLTGGLRNRVYTSPPYVRNSTTDASPRTVEDSSFTIEKENSTNKSEFSTSVDITSEDKSNKYLHSSASRPRVRASRANVDTYFEAEEQIPKNSVEDRGSGLGGSLTSLGRSSDDGSALGGRPVSSQNRPTSEGVEDPVQAYLDRRRQRKGRMESILRPSLTNSNVDSNEEDSISTPKSHKSDVSASTEKSTVYRPNKTPTNSEVIDQKLYSQKPSVRGYSDSRSRMPINYSSPDGHEADSWEAQPTSIRGGSNVGRVSRRTRPTSSVAKEDEVPTNFDQSVVSPVKESKSSSGKTKHTRYLDNTHSSKPKQSYTLPEEPSARNLQTESSAIRSPKLSQDESRQSSIDENDEKLMTRTSSEKSTSHESSSKSTSHVHPKLPDIDLITAHFQSLRANVRPK